MKSIVLTVPDCYSVPDTLLNACPYRLCIGLSCCALVIERMSECTDNNTENTDKYVRENVARERKRCREEFDIELQDMRDTKERILRECDHRIDEMKNELKRMYSMYTKAREEQHDELIKERERCLKEFSDTVSRITESSNNQIAVLKAQLETARAQQERQTECYETEKRSLCQWYESNTHGKDAVIESFTSRFDDMMKVIQALRSSSVAKGQFGESCVRVMLQEWFPKAEITDVSREPHSGDILFVMNDVAVMIETKTKAHLSKEDMSKFEYDTKLKKNNVNGALFLTTSCGVPNRGEFAFELIDTTPVLYVSKLLDSPILLHMSMTLLLHLVPVFRQFQCTKRDDNNYETLRQELGTMISHLSTMCGSVRQNSKLMHTITQQLIEQKRKNDEIMEWCMNEISRIANEYRLKTKNTSRQSVDDIGPLFDLLYKRRIESNGKYVYKTIVKETLKNNSVNGYNTSEQVFRVLPKSKFDELCKQREKEIM